MLVRIEPLKSFIAARSLLSSIGTTTILTRRETQIATVALAAHYAAPFMVVIGTTLGMLIADAPAVFVGDKLANKIPMKLVHSIAATIFALLGIATLLGAGAKLGI